MKETVKKQAPVLAALLLLFATQNVFIYLKVKPDKDCLIFDAAASVFFFALCAMRLIGAPFALEAIWAGAGCAGIAAMRGCLYSFGAKHFFVVFALAGPCLFLLSRGKDRKRSRIGPAVWVALLMAFAAAIVYLVIFDPNYLSRQFSLGPDYSCFIFPAIIILCGILRRRPKNYKKKKTPSLSDAERRDLLFAMIALALTFALMRAYDYVSDNYAVSLLWIAAFVTVCGSGKGAILADSC